MPVDGDSSAPSARSAGSRAAASRPLSGSRSDTPWRAAWEWNANSSGSCLE